MSVPVPGRRLALPALGWRPSEGQELLLRAALSPPSEVATAWQRASRAIDIERLDGPSHDLLPLLYRALAAGGVEDPWLGRLKGVYRRAWYANQLLLRRAAAGLSALQEEGIDTMVLGGAAVGLLHYRDLGTRPMSDTRIAVHPSALELAAASLRGTGWDGPLLQLADRAQWEAAVRLAVEDAPAHALCATDQLLRLCANGISWSSRPSSGRWVADALVIIESDAGIDWERLRHRAVEARVAPHLHVALAYLRETFAAPIPARVVQSLGASVTPLGTARLSVARARAFVHAARSL